MDLWKGEIKNGIFYFVRPAFRFLESVISATFTDIITAKREAGYTIDIVRRYNRALTRFADVMDTALYEHEKESGSLPPDVDVKAFTAHYSNMKGEVLLVRDILCALLDTELWWTPRWHNKFLEIAREEGLLDKTFEPD